MQAAVEPFRKSSSTDLMPTEPGLFSPKHRNLSIGALGLCSMIAFEAIGVATGMPAVAAAFDGVAFYALAFAATLAGSVVAMVWAGRSCDDHGPLRAMAVGMLLFALGLIMAGVAQSMTTLILGRLMQGLGVGSLVVALYVAMARALPESLHPRVFALFATAWVIPAIVGPAISGWIVEQLGWRWLFLGIAVLLLPTAALILPPLRATTQTKSNTRHSGHALAWAVLAAAGTIGLSLSALAGSWAWAAVALSLAAAITSAWRLLPGGTLRLARGLPTVIGLRGIISATFFLCEAFIPLWLHQQRDWSLTAAGMALTGGALSWSVGSNLQSRIHGDAARSRWLSRGCVLLFAGVAICGVTVLGSLPDWSILVGWAMAGLGVGLSFPMLAVLMLKLAPRDQQGNYSSALQLCSSLATSASLAGGGLLFSLLQARTPGAAFVCVFALALLLALIAALSSSRTRTVT